MTRLGDFGRHLQLSNGMASRLGVDLREATHTRRLSISEYAAMVTRCRGCAWASDCESWQSSSEQGIDLAELCETKPLIEMLRVA